MTAIESLALTNYGHFTTMRVEDGRVRGLGMHLDRLVSELDGTPQRPMGALWVEVHPRYVTQLGPDAATIGPPAGNDPRGANA